MNLMNPFAQNSIGVNTGMNSGMGNSGYGIGGGGYYQPTTGYDYSAPPSYNMGGGTNPTNPYQTNPSSLGNATLGGAIPLGDVPSFRPPSMPMGGGLNGLSRGNYGFGSGTGYMGNGGFGLSNVPIGKSGFGPFPPGFSGNPAMPSVFQNAQNTQGLNAGQVQQGTINNNGQLQFAPSAPAMLSPGTAAFLGATRGPDGMYRNAQGQVVGRGQ